MNGHWMLVNAVIRKMLINSVIRKGKSNSYEWYEKKVERDLKMFCKKL